MDDSQIHVSAKLAEVYILFSSFPPRFALAILLTDFFFFLCIRKKAELIITLTPGEDQTVQIPFVRRQEKQMIYKT